MTYIQDQYDDMPPVAKRLLGRVWTLIKRLGVNKHLRAQQDTALFNATATEHLKVSANIL